SAPASFADVEAESNELDLGATAAQAFSAEPAVVVPTVEPEPAVPATVTPEAEDEHPPFVISASPDASNPAESSPEIAFPSFAVPEPEPAPVFAPAAPAPK